jgi:hypothetical protein
MHRAALEASGKAWLAHSQFPLAWRRKIAVGNLSSWRQSDGPTASRDYNDVGGHGIRSCGHDRGHGNHTKDKYSIHKGTVFYKKENTSSRRQPRKEEVVPVDPIKKLMKQLALAALRGGRTARPAKCLAAKVKSRRQYCHHRFPRPHVAHHNPFLPGFKHYLGSKVAASVKRELTAIGMATG